MIPAREALERLREGNRRFASNLRGSAADVSHDRRAELASGQEPFAIILGCSDSRVPAELVFDQGLGDLFVIRVAGNIVAPSQVGSVEFAAARFQTRLVVVLGHTQCGAILATLEELRRPAENQSANLRSIVDRVRPSVEGLLATELSENPEALVREAVRANIRASTNHLRHGSPLLEQLIRQDRLHLLERERSAADLLLARVVYRPTTIDPEELEEQMSALGYSLDVQRSAVLFELTGFWDNYLQTIGQPLGDKQNLIAAKKHDIEQSLTSFFSKNQDNVIGYIGNDRFLVLKDLSTTDFNRFSKLLLSHYGEITNSLKNVYIKDVTVGIGSPSSSPAGLLLSAQEALQVLEVGRRLEGPNSAYRSDILGVLPLVISTSASQKKEHAERLLVDLDDQELSETLESFLEHDLNLTQTAEALKIHRNTVIYRLDKITEKIGKDPRSFTDAVELYLALQLVKIYS